LERIRDEAQKSTADNAAIVVFGEGTRSRTGEIAGFKPGAVLLAQQVGLPIVPLSIHGARDILPPDQMSARPGTIRIDVGTPIDTVGMPRRQLLQQVHDDVIALNVAAGGKGAAPSPRKARAAARAARADVEGAEIAAANTDDAEAEVAAAG
ncbi:MAG TPA: lysophospholipid acyltransferase family protein, partial [Myxococcota bacterium]